MSAGSYISEPMNGLNRVHVSVRGAVTIKVADHDELSVRSRDSVVINRGAASLWVKSPSLSPAAGGVVASGTRSVAANVVTGIITTGDGAVVNGKSIEPVPPGENVTIKVPAGTEVIVLRAGTIYDRTDDTITVEDGRE